MDMEEKLRYISNKILPRYILTRIAYPLYRRVRVPIRIVRRAAIGKVNKQELKASLKSAGIGPCDIMMVHSSLSSIGKVEGGAETVIQSLMETVTDRGTILVPAYRAADDVESDYKKGKLVDLRVEKSNSGTITERFRTRKDVLRSSHPFSSICAWGKDAAYVTSGHADDMRICHANSPLARLVELGGKVVGIGVNEGKVSVYHVVEDTWNGFPLRVYSDPFVLSYIDQTGKTITREVVKHDPAVSVSRIDGLDNPWIRECFARHLARKEILHAFSLGKASCWVIDARQLYQEMIRLAEKGITIYLTKDQWKNNNGGDASIERWA